MKSTIAHSFSFKMVLVLFCMNLFFLSLSARELVNMKNEWYRRSLQNEYDASSIKSIFDRVRLNKKITIGVIGGSITAGANSSDFGKTAYAPLVTQWFRERFPDAEIRFVNAGIGATNSVFGVHRVGQDLLSAKPDFVIVEFSVNDRDEMRAKASYEGLIRKILKSENKPAILALGLMDMKGTSWQKYHLEVCNHYHIPYISYRDAIYPEIECGNMVWSELSADDVHPNDKGHQIISNLVTHFLEEIYEEDCLPAPLTANRYEQATMYPLTDVEKNPDWHLMPGGLYTTHKGKPLTLTVKASMITIMFNKTIDPQKAANVYLTVDGKRKILNTFFENGWGDYMHPEIILESDKSDVHTLKIEYDDKSGKEFLLHNIQIIP